MRIEFTTASRRHRLGRNRVRHVLATATLERVITSRSEEAWLYVGPDDRGVVLDVMAVETDDDTLLVIHAMPYTFRGGGRTDG